MSPSIVAPVVDKSKVKRVYRGRPGCACGCNGDYSTNPVTISRVVNKINKLGPRTYREHKDEFVFADSKTRTYTAYFTKD